MMVGTACEAVTTQRLTKMECLSTPGQRYISTLGLGPQGNEDIRAFWQAADDSVLNRNYYNQDERDSVFCILHPKFSLE